MRSGPQHRQNLAHSRDSGATFLKEGKVKIPYQISQRVK